MGGSGVEEEMDSEDDMVKMGCGSLHNQAMSEEGSAICQLLRAAYSSSCISRGFGWQMQSRAFIKLSRNPKEIARSPMTLKLTQRRVSGLTTPSSN